jgi:hypothetical protein
MEKIAGDEYGRCDSAQKKSSLTPFPGTISSRQVKVTSRRDLGKTDRGTLETMAG